MQGGFVSGPKVNYVLYALGCADPNIKSIDDGLTEILLMCGLPEAPQVHAVESILVPETGLVELFGVESFILEGRHVELSLTGEHFTTGLQELLRMKVSLQHSFVY